MIIMIRQRRRELVCTLMQCAAGCILIQYDTVLYVLVRIFSGILPDPPRLLERLISGDQINRWGEKGGEKHMHDIIPESEEAAAGTTRRILE